MQRAARPRSWRRRGRSGIHIPTLCHHPSLEPYGSCRLCTVQIEKNGRKKFVTACNYPVEVGLARKYRSAEIADIRKMILELLLARCPQEKRLQELARDTRAGLYRRIIDVERRRLSISSLPPRASPSVTPADGGRCRGEMPRPRHGRRFPRTAPVTPRPSSPPDFSSDRRRDRSPVPAASQIPNRTQVTHGSPSIR